MAPRVTIHNPIHNSLHQEPVGQKNVIRFGVVERFAGVDLARAAAPDGTSILNFRHLLEEHDRCGAMLDTVNHYLEDRGIA